MLDTWSVYMHTNLINAKRYIGIAKNPEKRWKNGYGYHKQVFAKAIKKYGWDNFSHEILFDGLDRAKACELEIELIQKYHTNCKEYGYNISLGGDSREYLHVKVYQFDLYANLIKEYDSIQQAAKETGVHDSRIVNACKGKMVMAGDYLWRYVEDISDIHKFKEEFNPIGTVDKHYPIYEFDLESNFLAAYDSAWDAVKKNPERKLNNNAILKCCRNESNYSHGSIWKFQKDVENIEFFQYQPLPKKPCANKCVTPVLKYDLQGSLLTEYKDLDEASNLTGINRSNILKICNAEHGSAGNFQWRFKNDTNVPNQISPYSVDRSLKKVSQYDLEHNYITTYNSAREASEKTGICIKDIYGVCLHRHNYAKGYIWEYA